MSEVIPVALFAYARPDHLRRTLDSLRANQVPSIYAFSDGPHTPDKQPAVDEVRKTLRTIDWCEVVLVEGQENWGLGRSILAGVTDVLDKRDAVIVFEDDLICVPGTYQYLRAALLAIATKRNFANISSQARGLFCLLRRHGIWNNTLLQLRNRSDRVEEEMR